MTSYDPKITALLCIDLYNDFLSERGKLFASVKDIARENNMHENLRTIVQTAREVGIKLYHVPHHLHVAKGTWGGTFHKDFQVQPGDIGATAHWASSGFPNTDLDHQLKRYGKVKIILVGLLANTCVEAIGRTGKELGYHVTLVRDATSAQSDEALHAALDIDGPTYADEILSAAEVVSAMKESQRCALGPRRAPCESPSIVRNNPASDRDRLRLRLL